MSPNECRQQRPGFAFDDPANLRLWMMQLVVKAPERPFDGTGVVVLKEGMRDAEVGELRLMVGFNEEAARVAMDNRPQLKHAWKRCLDLLH